MSYTQTDLDTVRAARIKLASGEFVESITIIDQSITYSAPSLDQLAKLEAQIVDSLQADASNISTVTWIQSAKGL